MVKRLAIIVSHPIQYFAPLYQRLAARSDFAVKVFFTWHGGSEPILDRGFDREIAWDIDLTEGYDHQAVRNVARDPGTHHFFGLRNPELVRAIVDWKPDVVHVTGWAWASHLHALRAFSRLGIPTIFRGDSHLLDGQTTGPRWWAKKAILNNVFRWPRAFLVTGSANRAYYKAFGVADDKLFDCPHTIDVARFAEPSDVFETEARTLRRDLGIGPEQCVVLFAGKFEAKKRPVDLMRAVLKTDVPNIVLVMVGGGPLQQEVQEFAAHAPRMFRVVPFQNQSRMPVVYRLGDLFVLPSSHNETWGLAVNEALACGRPVLVSNRVGCAPDAVDPSCGQVFDAQDPHALGATLASLCGNRNRLAELGLNASRHAWKFDTAVAEQALADCIERVSMS